MNVRRLLLILLFCLPVLPLAQALLHPSSALTLTRYASAANAEETVLVGNVRDALTGEPLSDANIYFRGSKVGTTSNADGFFFMRVDIRAKQTLVVSLVGYKRRQFDILPGQSAGMEVLLEEKTSELATVVALPGSNAAIPLMEEVRAHRKNNDQPQNLPSTTTYFLSDIRPKHLKKKLWKNLQDGMVQLTDSTWLLPLPDDLMADLAAPLPEHFNLYRSHNPLGGTTFLSPLAASANSFYRFYLMDSTVVGYGPLREKHYRVRFFPKNSFNPTLSGIMEVDSATYALREVRAQVAREVNVNYLTDLRYSASYAPSGQLTDEELQTLMEVALKSDTSHLFPSLLACRRSERQSRELTRPDTLVAYDSLTSVYLHDRTPIALAVPDDSLVKALQDSLAERPLFRIARWTALSFYTGYLPTGTAIDIGRANEIFAINPVEKVHMALPFRTNARLSERISLGGYIGWGVRDRGLKWMAEMNAMLPAARRQMLTLRVQDSYAVQDVTAFGALSWENGIAADNMRFTARLFDPLTNRTYTFSPLARRREAMLSWESDWRQSSGAAPAVETRFSVQLGHQGYGDALRCHYYDMPSFHYASVRSLLRLGWAEKNVDFYMQRRRLYGRYPTVYLGAEMGSYTMPEESYQIYGSLNMMIRQAVPLGIAGELQYLVEGGMVLGRVPYPLLRIMSGNGGYTYSPERFTLMNNYQFAADRYLLAHVHYDGRGILFNQIPGIRYLRLHELLECKFAWGGLSDKHRSVIDYSALFGEDMLSSLHKPYAELGIGIGNILRIADVYSIWRLTDRSNPAAPRWGMRFRFNLNM